MAGRGMLDNEFEEFDDKPIDFGEDQEVQRPDKTKDKTEIAVEVVDDTPEDDRGKWVADKDAPDADEETEEEKYSKRVKHRIAQETAKVHAERRAKEDRERQLNEAVQLAQRLINENNSLKGLIENGEKVLVSESNGRLEGQINAAKAALREAHEASDISGQIAAQENLAKLVAERDRLSVYRTSPLPRMDEKEQLGRFAVQPPQQQQVQAEPAALEWQKNNKWFGKDDSMTAFALGFHQHLVSREGITPDDGDVYWGRLDKEMRTRFPERFSNEGSAPRRSDIVVAPASRSGGGRATRKVTLTESQARLARRLGLSLEQYAEQVAAEGNQKEWTHGKS